MCYRWPVLLLLVAVLCLPALSRAQCPGSTTPLVPFAEEVLAVSDTPVFLTAAIASNASAATISVRGGAINFLHMNTPTATFGHRMGTGVLFPICGNAAIKTFRAVREGVDATLTVTYFRPKTP